VKCLRQLVSSPPAQVFDRVRPSRQIVARLNANRCCIGNEDMAKLSVNIARNAFSRAGGVDAPGEQKNKTSELHTGTHASVRTTQHTGPPHTSFPPPSGFPRLHPSDAGEDARAEAPKRSRRSDYVAATSSFIPGNAYRTRSTPILSQAKFMFGDLVHCASFNGQRLSRPEVGTVTRVKQGVERVEYSVTFVVHLCFHSPAGGPATHRPATARTRVTAPEIRTGVNGKRYSMYSRWTRGCRKTYRKVP